MLSVNLMVDSKMFIFKKCWSSTVLGCFAVIIVFYFVSVQQYMYSTTWKYDPQRSSARVSSTHERNLNKRPLTLPDNATLETMTENQLMELYWSYINTLQVLCRNQTRLGSMTDGGKEVCIDDLYKPGQPCLVYSFGSNFQYDFEKDVMQVYKCEVHTFDPSVQIFQRNGQMNYIPIPSGINFHLTGLWDRTMRNARGWRMETISSIRKQLNHTNRIIDILKIDVEGAEWTALPEIFQSGVLKYVKQLCLEVHFGRMRSLVQMSLQPWGDVPLTRQLIVLKQLYEHGFEIFMREHNLFSVTQFQRTFRSLTTVNEISLMNTKFKDATP